MVHVKSRGFVTAARRLSLSVLFAVVFLSLVTMCWGSRTSSTGSPLLGSAARLTPAVRGLVRANGNGVVNFTNSPADEELPAWSPSGAKIAFTSNGSDSNGDGHLDTVGTQRVLYTMNADGSGLQSFLGAVPVGDVIALSWVTETQIAVVVDSSGDCRIAVVNLTTGIATPRYAAPAGLRIASVCAAPVGGTVYFDQISAAGKWGIYATAGAGVSTIKADTSYDYRHPVIAANATRIVFESNSNGRYRIYDMPLAGGTVRALTNPTAGDDTQAMPTADNKLVYTSSRFTSTTDLRGNSNVWVLAYAGQSAVPENTTTNVANARFFTDTTLLANQGSPAPHPLAGRAGDLLFVTDLDSNKEIYFGSAVDNRPPYITAPPSTYDAADSALTTPKKIFTAGDTVTVTVPVVDLDSGISGVWLQIKDPDPAVIDSQGINHVITVDVADPDEHGTPAFPTKRPIEFGPYDPNTNTYLDTSLNANHPGYGARAGATRLFSDEGFGDPVVPGHWLPMYDDGTHGDLTAGDGTYTCQWTTPTGNFSDWYLDVIVEDSAALGVDGTTGRMKHNRQRFDNVGGCTTALFNGGRRILLVDDFMDGQRFLTKGLPPVSAQYDAPAWLNGLYYFTGATSTATDDRRSPFVPDSEYGGADLWRILCRGAVPLDVLQSYGPTTVVQSDPNSGDPVSVKHGHRLVVWASPSGWYRMLGAGSGSLLETATQANLRTFYAAGGRIFLIGSDVATGLTQGVNAGDTFLKDLFGAEIATPTANNTLVNDTSAAAVPFYQQHLPHNFAYSTTNTEVSWYGGSLPTPRWGGSGLGHLFHNMNPSQYETYDPLTGGGAKFNWDALDITDAESRIAICGCPLIDGPKSRVTRGHATHSLPLGRGGRATTTAATYPIIGVSKDHTAVSGARSIFWTFGYEHITVAQRAVAALDAIEWLMDGSVAGTVVQINSLQPVANALVVVADASGTLLGAARTNGVGQYLVQGIRPGSEYTVTVTATGYYGTTKKTIAVRGGYVNNTANTSADTDFFLYRDINTCTINGLVTQDGVAVPGATVLIAPLGGGSAATATTDATGHYTATNLLSGSYAVSARHPQTNAASTTRSLAISSGATFTADLQFTAGAALPGTLSGVVTGNGSALAGASVRVLKGGTVVQTKLTDASGTFSFANLPSDTYTLETSAAGFASDSRVLTYDSAVGQVLAINLTALSTGGNTVDVGIRVYDGDTLAALGSATVQIMVGDTAVITGTSSSAFATTVPPANFVAKLNVGTYRVRVSHTDRRSMEKSLVLVPGITTTSLEFHLQPLLTLSTGIALFSLPGVYTDASNVPIDAATFIRPVDPTTGQASTTATLDLTDRLAYYDTVNALYTKYTAGTQYSIGTARAYWVRLNTLATVTQEGTAVSTAAPYARVLEKGWNLVGNPFPFTVDLYDCTITPDQQTTITWSQAVTARTIGNVVYTWDGRQYIPSTMLQPYMGYWVYTTTRCTLGIANITRQRSAAAERRSRPTSSDWRVRLEVRAGDYRDTANYFGVQAGGTDGFDVAVDNRKPPMPPGPYVALAFPRRAWGADGGDFAADIQAPSGGEKRWTVNVATNMSDTDVVVRWPELAAQLPAGTQAILRDTATGQSVYMNTTGFYSFRAADGGAVRTFEITVAPQNGTLRVSEVRGTAVRGESGVSFTLSQAAQVSVVIRAQTGRTVRALAAGLAVAPGATVLAWDGRDEAGHAVPRGVYLCEVRAVAADGRAARGTGLLLVTPVVH
jgi:Tol biopolymer transport system component